MHAGQPTAIASAQATLGLPLPVRVLLVLIHLRTNLTTRALAALFDTSQSAVDRVLHHLVPMLARALRPIPDDSNHPWIIDGTLIPEHDQRLPPSARTTAAASTPKSSLRRRRVVAAGQCWPGNRNDVIVARHTVVELLDDRVILGDGGYHSLQIITGLWNPKTHAQLRVNT
jgi:Helix-turn-helix of DDE superfamily endonuclease